VIDWSRCEVVESVPGRLAGAPVLLGTRLPVQAILDNYDDGLEPEQVAAIFEVAASDVAAVLEFRQRAAGTPASAQGQRRRGNLPSRKRSPTP